MPRASGSLYAACGSTALGIDAALGDLGQGPRPCIRSPHAFSLLPRPGAEAAPVIGMSMSGGSAEVLEILGRARLQGRDSLLVTGARIAMPGTRVLRLDLEGVPRRLLPLASCLLVHHLAGVGAGRHLAERPLPPDEAWPGLSAFLEAAASTGAVPVFVSPGDPFLCEALSSQYMEFLKRPAFSLSFPEWTHDFLWTLGARESHRFRIVHLGAGEDLSDRRFHQVQERLGALGIPQLALEPPSGGRPPATALLVQVVALMACLAERLGIDSEAEGSFHAKEQL